MFGKCTFSVFIASLFLATLASASLARQTATTTYEGSGNTMESVVATYQKLEPKLTAEQKARFKEAYDGICEAYQTSGILLASVMDAADAVSARTAMISYQRVMGALPEMIDKLNRLVQGFK
jgi:hypothetical protein